MTSEVQVVNLGAPAVQEVQSIQIDNASGGYFFVELNTNATGGSLQYSGYIYKGYPENDASGTTFGKNVESIISAMSNVKSNGQVTVSFETLSASSYRYLVTFPQSMGNVPQMRVHTTELEPAGQASAFVETIDPGNVISGSYTLTFLGQTTAAIASDATESDVRVALEALSTVGSVAVSRSDVDFQHGYRWTITFNSAMNAGNVPAMKPDGALLETSNTNSPAVITVSSVDGNQIGGTFSVSFTHGGSTESSAEIAFDATASEFKAALVAMPNNIIPAGTIAVSRVGPDAQRGYTWTVTFLSDYARTFEGDLNPFTSNVALLTGEDAVVTVLEVRKGTQKEVQRVAVTTSDMVLNSTMMRLEYNGELTGGIAVRPSNGTCNSAIVEVQTITSSTVNTKYIFQ